jgi:hypothetical protein
MKSNSFERSFCPLLQQRFSAVFGHIWLKLPEALQASFFKSLQIAKPQILGLVPLSQIPYYFLVCQSANRKSANFIQNILHNILKVFF